MQEPKHAAAIYVHADAARVWQACTQPESLSVWFSAPCQAFGASLGDPIAFGTPEQIVILGALQSFEPEQQLSYTFAFRGFGFEESSMVLFEFAAQGPVVLMRVCHDCCGAPRTAEMIGPLGWPKLLARLKTFLETGTAMPWPEE